MCNLKCWKLDSENCARIEKEKSLLSNLKTPKQIDSVVM